MRTCLEEEGEEGLSLDLGTSEMVYTIAWCIALAGCIICLTVTHAIFLMGSNTVLYY